jgi:hypothetical protein
LAVLTVFIVAFPDLFPLPGGYTADGNRIWPGVIRYSLRYHGARLVGTVICLAVLLVWQFFRPVSIRSALLIPIGFLFRCGGFFANGVIQYACRQAIDYNALAKQAGALSATQPTHGTASIQDIAEPEQPKKGKTKCPPKST